MFSKELENLIQATLEDGKLEDHEKAALIKRAQKEGVDLDELQIYIDSLLQRRQRELNEKKEAIYEKYEEEKKKAIGLVCPKCHKQVPPLTLRCDCGYEFTTAKSVSSVQMLSDKIETILSQKYKNSDPDSKEYKEEVSQRYQRVKEAINLFPVPNTKEDIIEFLAISAPNANKKGGIWGTKSGRCLVVGVFCFVFAIAFAAMAASNTVAPFAITFLPSLLCFGFLGFIALRIFAAKTSSINPIFIHNFLANAWRAKFDQVLMKGRSLRGDAEFTQRLDYYENQMKMNEIESKKIFGIKLFG